MWFIFLVMLYIILCKLVPDDKYSSNDVFIPFEDCPLNGMDKPQDNSAEGDSANEF